MSLYKNGRIYDIFVSSTKTDLEEQRKVVINEIRELGHRPVAMELFNAQSRKGTDFIDDCIRTSDIFISIVGRKVGSPARGKPYVTFEYRRALEYGKEIIIFAPDDDEVRSVDMNPTLAKYRQTLLSSGKIVSFFRWNDIHDFKSKVSTSIKNLTFDLDKDNKLGWIRSEQLESYLPSDRILNQISSSEGLRHIIEPFCDMNDLVPNLSNDISEKIAISDFVWKTLSFVVCAEKGINRLFIDGGSTTYSLCRSFNDFCAGNRAYYHHFAPRKLVIATNSIINLIELSVNIQGPMRPFKSLRLYPAPPTSREFGKSFGTLSNIVPETIYSYKARDWTLRPETRERLSEAVHEFQKWLKLGGSYSLSVISASGLKISGNWNGPWVKHHASMLLQQGIFRAQQPVLLIIDGAKWDRSPSNQQGYRVLFDDITWDNVLHNQPFALAISTYLDDKKVEIVKYFTDRKFDLIEDIFTESSGRKMHRLILFNDKFRPLVALG